MPTFSSTAELKSYILSRSFTAVNAATNTARDIIEKNVDTFYAQEPAYYLRTDRLRSSLTNPFVSGKGDVVEGEVHFDEGMLDYRQGPVPLKQPLPNGSLEGYANYANLGGSEAILNAAMTGDAGKLRWTNGTAIWNKSVPELKGKMYDEIKKELKSAGIPIQ